MIIACMKRAGPRVIFYDCQPLSNIHRRLRLSQRLSLQR
jgi:hypothetical protein